MTRFFRFAVIALLIVITCVIPMLGAHGQDLVDPGNFPSHPAYVHFGVGYYYQLQGDQSRAIEEFTEAIALLPEWGNSYAARGDSYAALGQYQLAINDYTIAITIYPDFVSALYTRGRARHALGDIDRAIADYENAISQWPEYALPYRGVGDIFFEQNELDLALTNYEMYISYVGQYPNEDEIVDTEVLTRTQHLRENSSVSLKPVY